MLVIIQGPPRSGKDTFVRELAGLLRARDISYIHRQVGQTLKEATHEFYAALIDYPTLAPEWDEFEDSKEEPNTFFLGLTPRQAYIDMHEKLIKPLHGDTTLARMTAEHLARSPAKVKIASGLTGPNDVHVLRPKFNRMVIVGIKRPAHRWDNRKEVEPDVWFHNNFSVDYMRNWIETVILPNLL